MARDKTLSDEQLAALQQTDVTNLIKKVQAGKPLTNPQWARIQQFANPDGTTEPTSEALNISELCKLLSISRPTFYKYRNLDTAPSPRPNGTYDVVAWRIFLQQHGISDTIAPFDLDASTERVFTQIWAAAKKPKASRARSLKGVRETIRALIRDAMEGDAVEQKRFYEIERLRLQCGILAVNHQRVLGEVVDTDAVVGWIHGKVGSWKKRAMSMPNTLAARLAMKKPAAIQNTLKKHIATMFADFAGDIQKELTRESSDTGSDQNGTGTSA